MNFYFVSLLFIALFTSGYAEASSDSALLVFGHQIEAELNNPGFEPKAFCDKFWLKSQASTCLAIPWGYVVKSGVSLKKVIETQNSNMGFTLFEIKNVMNQLFSVTEDKGKLFLSLDDSQVWQQFTHDWATVNSLKFASSPTQKTADEISDSIARYHQHIQSQFKIYKRLELPIYFVNSEATASDLGFTWDQNKLGGGARDGFILIIGHIEKSLRSTLLHEMVHSYTAYPGEFWKGPGVFSNALLSEGLATWIQIPEAWNDDVSKPLMAQSLCKDISNVRRKLESNFFELLDNNHFRSFDGQNGSFKSGYIAGAALISALSKSLSAGSFKEIWNQIGLAQDSDQIKMILIEKISESQLIEGMKNYLNWFESEIQNHANFSCAM